MRFEKLRNKIKSISIVLASSALVIIALIPGCKGKDNERRQALKAQPNVIIQNGATVLTMRKSTQENAGIISQALKTALYRQQMQAYGLVLQPDPLIDIHDNYIAARASVDRATSAFDASSKEYERLKKLNEEDQNVSVKAVQASWVVMSSDQAELNSVGSKLEAVKQASTAQWGARISQWVFSSSPEFRKLVELKDVLIRVTLPPDKFTTAAPETITTQAPGSRTVQAKLISRSPTTDLRIQGASYFYKALSGTTGLAPGLNVQILILSGPMIKGVIIPFSAVIWSQGKAWVYVQTAPERFSRREVDITNPARDGYFIQGGFKPDEMIVIHGAQILLSQELLPSKPAVGEEEED